MIIPSNTQMMLFRFSNYKKHAFIEEHKKIIEDKGYVWMMKVGKRTSIDKLNDVLESGGFLVLKAPIRDGGKYFICRFSDIKENEVDDSYHVPSYYTELVDDIEFYDRHFQLFKVSWIAPLPDICLDSLVLQLNGQPVSETIKKTRTAVMFIQNTQPIILDEGM